MTCWNTLFNDKRFHFENPSKVLKSFFKDYLASRKHPKVLDAGCGLGRNSIYLAGKGCEVYSVDISGTALKKFSGVIKDNKISNIHPKKANLNNLPYKDSHFDAVISLNVLNHGMLKGIKRCFNETIRVLRPHGLFLLEVAPMKFFHQVRDANSKKLEPGTYVNLKIPDSTDIHHFYTHRELKDIFKKFKILRLTTELLESEWMDIKTYQTIMLAQKR